MASVGIIANPASGKDIRRLVAHGSVFNNHDKVNIVRRVLLGLEAVGVDSVITMPDAFNICGKARDNLQLVACVRELDMRCENTQEDTTRAAARMRELGVDCLVSLGGDGTNRAVAKGCGDVPLLPLSTGTNNVFPYMLEGTLAGLAAGLVARQVVAPHESLVSWPCLEVEINGRITDMALVDVVVCNDPFIASRAVWDMNKVRLVVVAQRLPAHIGFMALASNLPLIDAPMSSGVIIETHSTAPAVLAPIAPGLIVPIGVRNARPFMPGQRFEVPRGGGTVALDGEREIILRHNDSFAIISQPQGPWVINPRQVLERAAQQGFFGLGSRPGSG